MDELGELSYWHWIIIAFLYVFGWMIPLWRIIGRTGRHPALSLIGFSPLTALVMLWWLAYARWPAVDSGLAPRPN